MPLCITTAFSETDHYVPGTQYLNISLAEYNYLEAVFKAIEDKTGQLADPFSGARFEGPQLDEVIRELVVALAKAEEQMPSSVILKVAHQIDPNGTSIPITREVTRVEITALLRQFIDLAREAKAQGYILLCIGD